MRSAEIGNISRAGLIVTLLSLAAAVGAMPSASAQKTRQPEFLVHANVFDDKGFTVSNARVRMRRANEGEWRWQTISDSEGEIALHVPLNDLYVLRVDAKGFQVLTQNVDATQTDSTDIALHLVRAEKGNPQ
jgi:hypothetical protein